MRKKKKWSEMDVSERQKAAKDYKKKTAKEIADEMDLQLSAIRTPLSNIAKKTSHGGSRPGSGLKKGTPFCAFCRKSIKKCQFKGNHPIKNS